MKLEKSDIFGLCAVVIGMVVCALAFLLTNEKATPPTIEAPVPGEQYSPFDYVIRVTAHSPEVSHVGVGTLVEYDEYTFVLTSKMIFTPNDTHYTVTVGGEQLPATLLKKDDRLGLVALAVADREFVGMEVDEAPNIPPNASVLVWGLGRSYDANVIRYLTDPDWLLLDGNLPGTCTGSPIKIGRASCRERV